MYLYFPMWSPLTRILDLRLLGTMVRALNKIWDQHLKGGGRSKATDVLSWTTQIKDQNRMNRIGAFSFNSLLAFIARRQAGYTAVLLLQDCVCVLVCWWVIFSQISVLHMVLWIVLFLSCCCKVGGTVFQRSLFCVWWFCRFLLQNCAKMWLPDVGMLDTFQLLCA